MTQSALKHEDMQKQAGWRQAYRWALLSLKGMLKPNRSALALLLWPMQGVSPGIRAPMEKGKKK